MTLDPAHFDPVQPSITATLFVALQFITRLWDSRKGTPVQRVEQLEVTVESLKRSNRHRAAEIEELAYRVRVIERQNEASG
jgi:hypothetical protein